MNIQANELLTELYKKYKDSGHNGGSVRFSSDREEKRALLDTLDYLEEKGLIRVTAKAIGFVDFKLTASGIDYMEENQ